MDETVRLHTGSPGESACRVEFLELVRSCTNDATCFSAWVVTAHQLLRKWKTVDPSSDQLFVRKEVGPVAMEFDEGNNTPNDDDANDPDPITPLLPRRRRSVALDYYAKEEVFRALSNAIPQGVSPQTWLQATPAERRMLVDGQRYQSEPPPSPLSFETLEFQRTPALAVPALACTVSWLSRGFVELQTRPRKEGRKEILHPEPATMDKGDDNSNV